MSAIRQCAILSLLLVGLLIFSLPCSVRAEDSTVPEKPEAWLRAVRSAAHAGQRVRLLTLAASPAMDPWIAVDALHRDGAFSLVGVFAEASPTSDATALRTYALLIKDPALAVRDLLERAAAEAAGGELAGAVRLLSTMPAGAPGKLRADALALAATYEMQKDAPQEAVKHLALLEVLVRELGWHQGQLDAMGSLFQALNLAGVTGEQEAVLERRQKLAVRIGAELAALETQVWQGGLLARLGRPRQGAELIRASLPRLEAIGADAYTAEAHGTLAQALAMAGEFALALNQSHLSEQAYTRLGDDRGVLYARSAAIATYSGLELGAYVCELCRQQVALAGESPAFASERAQARLTWAIAEARLGHERAGALHFKQAWAYLSRVKDVEGLAILHLNRGSELHERLGDRAPARADYESALALPGLSERLAAYGRVFLARLTPGEAGAAHASAALQAARDAGDSNLEVLALAVSSYLALEAGRPSEAHELAREATGLVLHGATTLGSEQGMGLLASRGPLSAAEALLRSALRLDDLSTLFHAAETSRALTLLTSMGGRGHVEIVAQPTALRGELKAARTARQAAGLALESARSRRASFGALRKLRKVLDARIESERGLDARLRGELARIAGVASPTLQDTATVRAWLRAHEAVLHLLVSDDEVHAVLVYRGGANHARLGPLVAFTKLVAELDMFQDPEEAPRLDAEGEPVAVRELARALLGELTLPKSVRHLVVMPPPELANLPWPLIGRATGGLRITLCPSASVLMGIDHQRLEVTRPRLAVGVSKYTYEIDSVARRVYARSTALPDLNNAASEARLVARGKGRALVNEAATEQAVQALLRESGPRRSVLHFACHGILDAKRPAFSALALLPSQVTDGFLTGAEILGLRVNSDLVVLSACDVGSMTLAPGEGAVGLPGALLGAGASRVLANLWRVSDDAGPAFMRMFYAHLKRHGDPHAALQHAQALLPRQKAAWAHPYYWAGWVLWGSPR